MPQVDAVGPDAKPAQWAPAELGADPAGRAGRRGYDRRGCEAEQDDAAAVKEGRELPDEPDHDRDDDEPSQRERV